MAGRRDKNQGTIRKRSDGRWEGRVLLPDGKRKYFYGQTRQEVVREVNQAVRDLEAGLPVVTERQTVGAYLLSWLDVVKHQLEPGTFRRYRNFAQTHIIPKLGKVQLAKLTPQNVQMLYAALLDKGLSPTTVRHVHFAFHSALENAVTLGLIQRNVTELVKPPRRAHHEMLTLTKAQTRRLLSLVSGDRFEAVYVLALTTGMREGEIFALRWQDVNLEQRTLSVRMALKEAEKGYAIGKTKTSYSRRRISLSQNAAEALRRHRARQEEEKQRAGASWDVKADLVFPNHWGKPMIADNFVKRHFKPLLPKIEAAEETRFHDLRHTCATLLLSEGVNPKVVSEMLGHADVSITLRIYAHVLPGMHEVAAATMDDIVGELFPDTGV